MSLPRWLARLFGAPGADGPAPQPGALAPLDAVLAPLIRQGLLVTPHLDGHAAFQGTGTKFGGLPYAEAGERWPACSGCDRDLSFIAQFAHADMLQALYYCFECQPWGLDAEAPGMWSLRTYHAPDDGKAWRIEPRPRGDHELTPCTASVHPVQVLPDWAVLARTHPEAAALCARIDAEAPWNAYQQASIRAGCLDGFATLIGGYPRFVQAEVRRHCKRCEAPMEFLLQVDSQPQAHLQWGDLGLVYLYRCPLHHDEIHLELQCH